MQENRTSQDVLQIQGRMTLGYGIIPKIPMQDQRLTIEAKAIYSYFCSYAGAGTTAFPSRDKILFDLQISKDRFYRHFDLLKKYRYIDVKQNVDNTGKFKNNIYTLIEMIEPCHQNKDTDKKPCPCFTDTENKDTINNSLKSNNLKKIISNQSVLNERKEKTDSMDTISNKSAKIENDQKNKESFENANTVQSKTHFLKPSTPEYNYIEIEEIIKNQISYDFLVEDKITRKDMLDEIVFVITTTICSEYNDGYISMGEERVPAEAVRAVFFKLSSEHIEYFIDCFNRQTETITKLPAYIRKSLYYNYGTVSHHYTNRVHHDMPQLAEIKL